MIELKHTNEPTELSEYRRRNPASTWDDPAFNAIKPIVRQHLNMEQERLCVYCEKTLHDDEGHIEHIKSKGLNPNLTFVYDNLSRSCDGSGHCGHHKKRQILPIEPRTGCNRYFILQALDGKLSPAPGLQRTDTQNAAETLRILGLNTPGLARRRKSFIDSIRYLSNHAEVAEFISTAPFRWSLQGI